MASISATVISTVTSPEVKFLCTISSSRRFRLPVSATSRFSSCRRWRSSIRMKALSREENAVVEAELVRKVNGSVKRSSDGDSNGALITETYTNGNVVGVSSENDNESFMVKYVNGNGNGVVKAKAKAEEVVEKRKNMSIEEIGQEEAWFKKNDRVEDLILSRCVLTMQT